MPEENVDHMAREDTARIFQVLHFSQLEQETLVITLVG